MYSIHKQIHTLFFTDMSKQWQKEIRDPVLVDDLQNKLIKQ